MKAKGQGRKLTPPEREQEERQAQAARDLKAKAEKALKDIKKIRDRYQEKSRVQLVRRIYLECGAFAAELEIARIERNQGDRLSQAERMSLEEDKRFIRNRQPAPDDCPCNP